MANVGDEFPLETIWGSLVETAVPAVETSNETIYEYSEPLSLEWGLREWIGLAVFSSTFLTALLLTLLARCMSSKSNAADWHLTEHGVGELLRVGWRYEQQLAPQLPEGSANDGNEDGRQLVFLQVFDKGRGEGYNDENSLLQGGSMPDTAETVITPPSPESLRDIHDPIRQLAMR